MPLVPSRRTATRKLSSCLLALVATALVSAVPAAAHFSARKAIWGPDVHGKTSLWPTYRKLGIGIYEDALDWSFVATTRPSNPLNPHDPAYLWPADVTRRATQPVGAARGQPIRRLRHRGRPALPERAPMDDLGGAKPPR